MAYLFDPEVLARIVRMHLGLPLLEQFDAVKQTLKAVYGNHINLDQPWTFSNAGGLMCAISPMHVSHNEYVLFAGTAIGTEGHSGRHRADMFDIVMAGELWTYQAGSIERRVHRAGDLTHLARGTSNGSKLQPGVWMLEYARGNIMSLFPFALADTLFSTLDTQDLARQLSTSTRLMAKEALVYLDEKKRKLTFQPNLEVLKKIPESTKRTKRSANVN